jgi:hypothetical protein
MSGRRIYSACKKPDQRISHYKEKALSPQSAAPHRYATDCIIGKNQSFVKQNCSYFLQKIHRVEKTWGEAG